MDTIIIRDLTVQYRVGVTETERSAAQRLLISLELGHDFTEAAQSDDLERTIDYAAVVQWLIRFGEGKSWRLIESLAVEIAEEVRQKFRVATVCVEIKKFVLPETRYVAVRVTR